MTGKKAGWVRKAAPNRGLDASDERMLAVLQQGGLTTR